MSRYSKKHYEDIAAIIKGTNEGSDYITKFSLVTNLALMFKQDNPNFDWDRFVEPCK